MTFRLGATSEANLVGVDERLARCVRRAITHTGVDFGVFEGLRTPARQADLFAAGMSRTMNSKHLTGHAVDLVPYIAGRLQWQMPGCIAIAIAMREASLYYQEGLIWGGVFGSRLSELDPHHLSEEIEDYAAKFRLRNKRPALIDGPHFELADI